MFISKKQWEELNYKVSVLIDFGVKMDQKKTTEVYEEASRLVNRIRIEELEWCSKRPHGGQAGINEIRDRIKELKTKAKK